MNSETRLIELAILIATILGFIIQPILSFYLEGKRDKKFSKLERDLKNTLKAKEERIKNLERRQENYEKIKHSELKELVRKFKKLHIDNSKSVSSIFTRRDGEEWRAWYLDLEDKKEEKEEYDEIFFEKIEKAINKVNIPDDEFSFVGSICRDSESSGRLSRSAEIYELIKWKKYKEILIKSNNAFNYFNNLRELVGSSRNIIFSVSKMDLLFSKILS